MKDFVVYTLGRLALFVATYAVLGGLWSLVGEVTTTSLFVIIVLAAVISSLLSLKFLAGPRDRFAARVEQRASRATAKFDEIKSREDVD